MENENIRKIGYDLKNTIKILKQNNINPLTSLSSDETSKVSTVNITNITNYLHVLLNGCINNYYIQAIKPFQKYIIIINVPNTINSFNIKKNDIQNIYKLGILESNIFLNKT